MSSDCDKVALRRRALQTRDAAPFRERRERSRRICHELIVLLDSLRTCRTTAPTVAVYAAMRSEVDLDAFIRAAYERGCRVAFPCMQEGQTHQVMCMRAVSAHDYRENTAPFIVHPVASFEPASGEADCFPLVLPSEIDMVTVPLVAFDPQRNRLGYGGGNYDRYLPDLRPDCLVAGVAFAEQQVERVPTEPHDRPLPRIIAG